MNSAASSNEALIQPRKQTMVPKLKRTRCWGNYDTANQKCLRKTCENKGQYINVDRKKNRDVNNKIKSIDDHEDFRSITKANINIQGDMIRQQQNDQKIYPYPDMDDYKIHKARTVNDMLTERVDKNKNCKVFDLRDIIDNDYSYRQNGMHDVMQNDDSSVINLSVSGSIGYLSHSDNIRDKDIETLSETKDCGSRQHLADTEHKAFMKLLKHILNDIDAPPQKNVHNKENQDTATTQKFVTNIEEDQHLKKEGSEQIFPKFNLEYLKGEQVDFKYYFPKPITSENTMTRPQVSSSKLIQKTQEVLNAQAAEKRKINEENQKRKDNEKLEREKNKLESEKSYLLSHYIKKQAEGFEQNDDKKFIDRNKESEEAKRKYYEGDAKEAKLFDKDKSGSDKDDRILPEKFESAKKKEREQAAQEKEWRAEVEKEQTGAKKKITMIDKSDAEEKSKLVKAIRDKEKITGAKEKKTIDKSEADEKSEIDKAKKAKEKSVIDKAQRDEDKVTSEGAKLKGKDELSGEGFNQIKLLKHLNITKKSGQKELEQKDKHVVDKTKLSEKDKLIPDEQVTTGGKGGNKSTSPEKYKIDQKIKGEDEKSKAEKHDKSKVSTTKEPKTIVKKQQAELKKYINKSDIDMKGDTVKSQAKPSRDKSEQKTQDLGQKANQSKDSKFATSPEKDKQDPKIKGGDEKAKTEKIDKSKVSTPKEPETITEKQQAEYMKNIKKSDIDMIGGTVKIRQAKTSTNKPGKPTHDLGDYKAKGGKLVTSKSPVASTEKIKPSNKPIKTEDQKKEEKVLNRERAEATRALKEKKSAIPDRVNIKDIQIKKTSLPNLAVARIHKDVKNQKMKSVSRLHLPGMLLNKIEPVIKRSISLESVSEIIVHQKLYKSHPKKLAAENEVKPMFFKTTYRKEVESDLSFGPKPKTSNDAKKAEKILVDQQSPKGIMRYALSDRSFIEKGWTLLPTEKVVRKMNVYRMRPARPEFDWFEHNKHKSQMHYDTGEKLAEFDEKGRGRWYYRNGNLALEYYDCEELNAHQRFILFSSGEPDERGRSRPPMDILATFDYNGNGIVFDHTGKIRLKYNQTEGVVLDKTLGPVSNWKWHSLNDPPVLQQVMIDTQLPHKDPRIMKLGAKTEGARHPDNEDMLAIEFDNFIKEKSKKMNETTFKPFQIKMKALKINENFSLRVLDQATVYLMFRDGKTNLKLNLGMILDHKEIVDTDIAEVGQVTTSVDKLPARTDSVAALQQRVAQAQRAERARAEHTRRLRQPVAPASADRLTAAASRAPRRPLVAGVCAAGEPTYCTRRASTMLVYYQNQLM